MSYLVLSYLILSYLILSYPISTYLISSYLIITYPILSSLIMQYIGAYDRESVEYIVNSEEGKKYWHFFKHMLLGSEEHYYVSLLYNWPRTKAFIQSLSAQSVWNTWKLGT